MLDSRKAQAYDLALLRDPSGEWVYGRDRLAREVGLSRDQARRVINRARAEVQTVPDAIVHVLTAHLPKAPPPVPHTATSPYVRAADAFLGWLEAPMAPTFAPKAGPVLTERYAVLTDIHAPWHDQKKLTQACDEAEAAGCETVVIGGDFFEYQMISSHSKSKTCSFEEELAGCRIAAEYVASRFKRRLYIPGNHEARYKRYVEEEVGKEIRHLVPDVTSLILDGLGYEYIGHKAVLDGVEKDVVWLAQIGEDAIVSHWQVSSAQQGVNLEKLKQWLIEWGGVLGLTDRPRFILTGHTHRGTTHDEHDRVLVEAGFLASWDVQDYQYSGTNGASGRNRKPGTHGWTLLVQENGRTDIKQSRFQRLSR